MKNNEVAEKFVGGCEKATGSHMFIEGNCLFSYGSHFIIAIRIKSGDGFKYIVNNAGYSSSTSRHKNYFKRAVNQEDIIKEVVFSKEMDKYKYCEDIRDLITDSL